MTAAYVEHRPRSTEPKAETRHYTVVVDGNEQGIYPTQKAARDWACDQGYAPVHVARVRHEQDRGNPDHWRKDPC